MKVDPKFSEILKKLALSSMVWIHQETDDMWDETSSGSVERLTLSNL